MQLKRSILYWAKGNKSRIEALAFLVMLKKYSSQSTINRFSVNKISTITGCSWATCKKYIRILIDLNIVGYSNEDRILVLKRLSSGTKHRNIPVDGLDFRKLKYAKDSVRHLIHMLSLSAKRFIRESIRTVTNPKKWPSKKQKDDYDKAVKFCKKFSERNAETGKYEYNDYGMSYKTIAKNFGVSEMTAFRIIKSGVKKHLFKKYNHYNWEHCDGTSQHCYDYFTFVWEGYGCTVTANTYELSGKWEKILCTDIKDALRCKMSDNEVDAYFRNRKQADERMRDLYMGLIEELADFWGMDKWEIIKGSHFTFKELKKQVEFERATKEAWSLRTQLYAGAI